MRRRSFVASLVCSVIGLLGLRFNPVAKPIAVGDVVWFGGDGWTFVGKKAVLVQNAWRELGVVVWISPDGLYGVRTRMSSFSHPDGKPEVYYSRGGLRPVPAEIYGDGWFGLHDREELTLAPEHQGQALSLKYVYWTTACGKLPEKAFV